MAKYFAGNSLACFSRSVGSIVEATTAGTFDSSFVSNAITVNTVNDYIEAPAVSITGTFWVRFDYYLTNSYNTGNVGIFAAFNGSVGVVRIQGNQVQYWNGSAWTNTGAALTASSGTLYTFVLKVVLNSGFELYRNGALIASGSGWTGGGTTVTSLRWGMANSTSGTASISQVMVADYDLRDSKYLVAAISGNSAANTSGTGAFTDVNETVLNDSTAVALSASGNKKGFTETAITVPAGYTITASVLSARGRATGTITDGKLGIRSGGTNYSSAALGYTTGYGPKQRIDENDPGTASPYTQAGFNAIESYVEAA